MLNMGWEYPAHMLRADGAGLEGAVSHSVQGVGPSAETDQTVRI